MYHYSWVTFVLLLAADFGSPFPAQVQSHVDLSVTVPGRDNTSNIVIHCRPPCTYSWSLVATLVLLFALLYISPEPKSCLVAQHLPKSGNAEP